MKIGHVRTDAPERYDDVRLASSLEVFSCEHCGEVTIVLCDASGRPYAGAGMDAEKWASVCQTIVDECLKVSRVEGDRLH